MNPDDEEDGLCCPITHEIMKDPVKAPDGHTYERDAIVAHLSKKNESPLTRQTMTVSDLVPDYTMKHLIEQRAKKKSFDMKTLSSAILAVAQVGGNESEVMHDLISSIAACDHEAVEYLLQSNGANPNQCLSSGDYPVHLVARVKKNATLLLYALSRGPVKLDLNVRNAAGDTAMHIAAALLHEDLGVALVDLQADPNIQNNAGDTPLHVSVRMGARRFAQQLIQIPTIQTNIINNQGQRAQDMPGGEQLTEILKVMSIYYNPKTLNSDNLANDTYLNPVGDKYDLGKDGAFTGFSLYIGMFFVGSDLTARDLMDRNGGPALKKKGFRLTVEEDPATFAAELDKHHVAWVISAASSFNLEQAVVDACKKFVDSGRGLHIWADNAPWFATANAVLRALFPTNPCVLEGNDRATNTITRGLRDQTGHFGAHLLTTNLVSFYEGVTICYPRSGTGSDLHVIATSSHGRPCVLVAEPQPRGTLPPTSGRVIVDTGYTKLYVDFNTAGTSRYLTNSVVWLLGLDHKDVKI